jgi:hypothetical protein
MLLDAVILLYLMNLFFLLYISKKAYLFPFSLYSLFIIFAIAEIPYLFYFVHNPEMLSIYVKPLINDFDALVIKHIFNTALFINIAFVTMCLYTPKIKLFRRIFNYSDNSENQLKIAFYFLISLTVLFYMLFLNKVGGLTLLIANISNKSTFVQGTALYRTGFFVAAFLAIGVFIEGKSRRDSKNWSTFKLLLIVLFCFALLASFGERQKPILLLIYTALLWNYKINNIKIFNVKLLISFVALIVFSSLAPVLRQPDAIELYLQDPLLAFQDAIPYLGEIFKRFSDIDLSIFVYSQFKSFDDYWVLATLKDFFTGFIPMSIFADKPPLDSGVYIYNMAIGNSVDIGSPFKNMFPVGWPLSRVTSGYVNFGYAGILIFAPLTGIILKYFYQLMLESNFSAVPVLLFTTLIFSNFGLSNAYVFNLLIIFICCLTLSFILNVILRSIKNERY